MQRGAYGGQTYRNQSVQRPYRRPVLVVQSDLFNRSRINTVVTAAISGNPALAHAPGIMHRVKLVLR